MELIILVLVGLVVWAICAAISAMTPPTAAAAPPPIMPRAKTPPMPRPLGSTLKLDSKRKKREIDGIEYDMLEFSTSGIFSSSRDILLPKMVITMHVDVEGQKMPVLCVIEDWQAEENIEFELHPNIGVPFPAGSGSSELVTIGGVPIDVLVFPNAGACKVTVNLKVYDGAGTQEVVGVSTAFTYLVPGRGYLDSMEMETKLHGHMIKLALYMASVDGHTDDQEVAVIKRWGKRMVDALPQNQQVKKTEYLNKCLSEATQFIRRGDQALIEKRAVVALCREGEKSHLYDAYELCLNVIEADGEAHPEEMALLSSLAKGLGLNEEKARAMLDKKVAKLTFTYSDNSDSQDKHLGITAGMSKDEIRKHLSKLFRKHNSRRSSDDSDVRAKAKEWLDMIAEARARHV